MSVEATSTMPSRSIIDPNIKHYMFLLNDREDSDFVLQGTEKTSNPMRLNAPRLFRLPNQSFKMETVKGVGKRQVKIRYIHGENEIEVELQKKYNIEPHSGDDTDNIYFANGRLIVSNEPANEGKLKYLLSCFDFQGAPDRPEGQKPTFFLFEPEKEAASDLKKIAAVNRARNLVSSLYEETASGFVFDERRIDFLCRVFGIVEDSYEAKTRSLMFAAETTPKELYETITSKINEVRATLSEALTLGVLSVEGKEVSMHNGQVTTPVFSFDKKINSEDERMTEMAMYFHRNEEAVEMWRQLLLTIDFKRKSDIANNE